MKWDGENHMVLNNGGPRRDDSCKHRNTEIINWCDLDNESSLDCTKCKGCDLVDQYGDCGYQSKKEKCEDCGVTI